MADPCRNCGAPSTGSDPYGPICCAHCAFNPLGCRCKYGELGVAETMDWFDMSDLLEPAEGTEFWDGRWDEDYG